MMPPRRVAFVGTDTGVGKTWVATRVVSALRQAGLRTGVLKPIESGCGTGPPLDAQALAQAAGGVDLATVCPWSLPGSVAPAAELERLGLHVSARDLVRAACAAESRCDVLIVETAGGVLSPITPSLTSLDLASLLGATVVLVAPSRLGVISAVATAVEAARARDTVVAAIALNRWPDAPADVHATNVAWIRRSCPETRLVEVDADVAPLIRALRLA